MTDDAPAAGGEPVLIVDDEKNILRTLRMVLESEGHAVHEASTIIEAEAVLAREAIDLVLLDVKLGDENGLDLLERDQGARHGCWPGHRRARDHDFRARVHRRRRRGRPASARSTSWRSRSIAIELL